MAIQPLARRCPDMSYLRVTTAFNDGHDLGSPEGTLPTPASTNCEDRRSSITSDSWLFLPGASNTSNTSSVSSFQSSHEPATPPPNGLPLEFATVDSDLSVDEVHMGVPPTDLKGHYLDTPLSARSSTQRQSAFDLSSEAEWSYGMRAQHGPTSHTVPSSADHVMQHDVSFTEGLNGNLLQRQQASDTRTSDFARPWSSQGFVAHMSPEDSYKGHQYTQWNADQSYVFGGQFMSQSAWMTQNLGIDVSTIVPTETIIEDTPGDNFCSSSIYGNGTSGRSSEDDHFDGIGSDPRHSASPGIESPHFFPDSQIKRDLGRERVGSPRTSKKLRRSTTMGRRKPKPVTFTNSHNGRILKVAAESTPEKKHACTLMDKGQICGKRFQRKEHLRRHISIHEHPGTVYYTCPHPKCHRTFKERADNRREHYKIHLKLNTSKREKISSTFEEFYGYIRAKESPEEAQKSIDKLEKWKAQGKHLPSGDPGINHRPSAGMRGSSKSSTMKCR